MTAAAGDEYGSKINPDRGITSKPLPNGGPMIHMVKSEPGVYYDATGRVATDEQAIQAGFDVRRQRLEAEKNRRIAEATAEVEREMAERLQSLEREVTEELDEAPPEVFQQPQQPQGASAGDEPDDGEPDDGSPFVYPNEEEPRRARLVQDGPVRAIRYDRRSHDWEINEETDDPENPRAIATGLDKDTAMAALLGKLPGDE